MKQILLFALFVSATLVVKADSGTISILSPLNGDTLVAGGTTSVVLRISNPAAMGSIVVTGSQPFQGQQLLTPAESMTIPISISGNTPPGRYGLQVLATSPNGVVASLPVLLFIRPASPITNIVLSPRALLFRYIGDSANLDASGEISTIRRSLNDGQLSFSSSDPTVATVTSSGVVIARGIGQATIRASLPDGTPSTRNVSVSVMRAARGDMNADGIIDIYDVNALTAQMGQVVLGSNDQRDLNGDGKIDALDLRILVTLCTYPRCASALP